ncbi:MAG: AMMECR1 domain-containing protein [Firmicutes bacterium]|nr:AMMECR1 domain-containing protein [Bacillota bacterium]
MKKIIFLYLFLIITSNPLIADSENKLIFNTPVIQKECLKLSRKAMTEWIENGRKIEIPANLPSPLFQQFGVFISIEKNHGVRGCQGTIHPKYSAAAEEIINNSIRACSRDTRYPPIKKDEIDKVRITVCIVFGIEQVFYQNELNPKRYGLLVSSGSRNGVILPLEAPNAGKQLQWALKRARINGNESFEMFRIDCVRFTENPKEKEK